MRAGMKKAFQTLRSRLPRRRQRQWRYVSPRRRGVGLLALALLMAMVYGYWYVTNDHRIRQEAASYLQKITGLRVAVKDAHFSLFGEVELRGVTLIAPNQASHEPFIFARRVLLRHRPQSILTTGHFSTERITLINPVIVLEYDPRVGDLNVQKIVDVVRSRQETPGAPKTLSMALPTVQVLDGRLRIEEVHIASPHLLYEEPLNMTMVPDQDRYRVTFEGERQEGTTSAIQGTAVLNVAEGTIEHVSGKVPIRKFHEAMPEEYRRWLERYGIGGDRVEVSRDMNQDTMIVRLVDVALKLPEAEGGLDLGQVNGELAFTSSQVSLRKVSGCLTQAGGAKFEISGTYRGYQADSPFQLELKAQNFDFGAVLGPQEQVDEDNPLTASLRQVRAMLEASGQADVLMNVQRDGGGATQFSGCIQPRKMSAKLDYFPYSLDDLEGAIRFNSREAIFESVTGRHGGGSFTINGKVQLKAIGTEDVTVDAQDVELNDDLQRALPEKFKSVWDYLRPGGRGNGRIRIHRQKEGEKQQIDVTMLFDGQGKAVYSGFPYPLENLSGEMSFAGDRAELKNLKARRGTARCQISGSVCGFASGDTVVDLRIDASRVPIDLALRNALPEAGRSATDMLDAAGDLGQVVATVRRPAGGPLTYDIQATVDGMSFCYRDLPYSVSNAKGVLSINPDNVEIRQISGRHGDVPVSLAGKIFLNGQKLGADVAIQAQGVPLDKALYDALPKTMQSVWRDLSPSAGKADIRTTIRHNVPDAPERTDYRLEMDLRDVTMKYVHFPYAFRGVSGRVASVPGMVVLGEEKVTPGKGSQWTDMTAAWGDTRARLHGKIVSAAEGDRTDLTIQAENVPVDRELLAALPEELAPLSRQIVPQEEMAPAAPGGKAPRSSCGFDLPHLTIVRQGGASSASQPSSPPATQASQPASGVAWKMDGQISFQNTILKLGLDPKTLTGSIKGGAQRQEEGISLEAAIALQSVEVENRRLTDFHGMLHKGPGPLLRISDIAAKSHGGEVAGEARIWLTDPLVYGVGLDMRRVLLSELFPLGPAAKAVPLEGFVEGRVNLMYKAGDPKGTSATGELTITEGKITKLPVMLDLLHVMPLSPPSEVAFSDAYLVYQLRGDILTFEKIYLRSPRMAMKGYGTVNLKTRRLDLVFASGSGLEQAGGLIELVGKIAQNVTGVRVSGSIEKPRVQSTTLSGLESSIRELYGTGP